jgi:hypothetical protein
MGKSRAPEIDEDGLRNHLNKHDLVLLGLRNRFLQFEESRKAKKLGTAYIALDALAALIGGRLEGYSDADLKGCWPEAWGSQEVMVPASFLKMLGLAWIEYKENQTGRTLGEVLELEGGGQGRQRSIAAQKTRDLHTKFAREVLVLYTGSSDPQGHPSLNEAIETVAERNGVGFDTVKDAYKLYGKPILEQARKVGLLKGG